jgi:hypothetical protein
MMKLNSESIEDFKSYLIQSMNEDVYYQLKHWVDTQIDDDQNFNEVIDFFVDNLHGSLQWID